jgi:hypothetical protein
VSDPLKGVDGPVGVAPGEESKFEGPVEMDFDEAIGLFYQLVSTYPNPAALRDAFNAAGNTGDWEPLVGAAMAGELIRHALVGLRGAVAAAIAENDLRLSGPIFSHRSGGLDAWTIPITELAEEPQATADSLAEKPVLDNAGDLT